MFNPTARQSFPARFEGVESIEGLETYKFVTTVPETVIRETEVPGALLGRTDVETVDAEVVYTNERTIWVEPASGVIVTAQETPNTVLRGSGGTTGPTMLAGTFSGTDETIAAGVERAEDTASQINLVKNVLPLVLALLGIVALVVGALLLLRAERGARHRDDVVYADGGATRVEEVH